MTTARLRAILAAGAAAATGAVPGLAAAGTYDVLACSAAPAAANNAWTASNTNPSSLTTGNSCPAATGQVAEPAGIAATVEDGLFATDRLAIGGTTPDNGNAGWTFTAATGTTITRLRSRHHGGRNGDSWQTRLLANGAVLQSCTLFGSFCAIGSLYAPDEPSSEQDFSGLNATTLRYEVACDVPNVGETCGGGSTLHEAWVSLYAARVTISDTTPPTAVLTDETPTDWVKGDLSASTLATDAGGGIRTVSALIDGDPAAGFTSECDVTTPRACPPSAGPELAIPTATLTDGEHDLVVIARDAGGESASLTRTIRTDNSAPVAPTLAASPATGVWHATREFAIVATLPGGQASPIETLHWRLCGQNGACGVTEAQPATNPVSVALSEDGPHTVAVWLEDSAGNVDPSDRAELVVFADTAAPAAVADARATGGPDVWNVAWARPEPGASPEAALVTVCDPAGRCRTDDTGPSQTATVTTDQAGEWTVAIRMRDATGAEGPSTTLRLERPVSTSGPMLPPVPPVPTSTATPTSGPVTIPASDPGLRLESVRVRGGVLRIHGRVRAAMPAVRPRVKVRWELPSGAIIKAVKIRADAAGRFTGTLRLGTRLRAAKAAVVTASVPSSPPFVAARAVRRVTYR